MTISNPSSIKLVVFDLAGTLVDHGCQAPVSAVVDAFHRLGIEISALQARGPMGMSKIDHIRELFKLPDVARQWHDKNGRPWREEDVAAAYEQFLPLQTEVTLRHADLTPGALDCFHAFKARNIVVGTTTGYPRSVAAPLLDALARCGIVPDASVCADEVRAGRPAPWMIQQTMAKLNIESPQSVVKVGDTTPDIQAARNAAVWAVGITESGSEFGLTADELAALAADEREAKHSAIESKFRAAGAHAVIKSLSELPQLLESDSFQ